MLNSNLINYNLIIYNVISWQFHLINYILLKENYY